MADKKNLCAQIDTALLKKNNLKQKQFIIGLIEDALEQDEEDTAEQLEEEEPDEPDTDAEEE